MHAEKFRLLKVFFGGRRTRSVDEIKIQFKSEDCWIELARRRIQDKGTENLSFVIRQLFSYVRSEVFTAMTIKDTISLDIKTQFLPRRKIIRSTLQSPAR
jgi:hypothetical protein